MALKDLKVGSDVKLGKLSRENHETKPPTRFSEPKLAHEVMEVRGIARPSTISSIISLIQDRGYVAKKGSQLYPTALGFAVARLLAAKFPQFTAYDYTASMEEELEEIKAGKQTRIGFLNNFWNGKDGFEATLKTLLASIDFKELEQYSVIDLYNGYSIRFSKFGTFLQDDNGTLNEAGYLPSGRIDDEADVWDYKDVELCKTTIENASKVVESKELGILDDGEYMGWTVTARTGKFGPYVQAMHPDHVKLVEAGKKATTKTPKPINHALDEKFTIDAVTLSDVKGLFAEVKLPRHLSDQVFVGIGKRGPWIARKASAKAKRAVFISMPEELDPRAITLEEAEAVWKEKQDAKKAKPAPKTKAKPKVAKK